MLSSPNSKKWLLEDGTSNLANQWMAFRCWYAQFNRKKRMMFAKSYSKHHSIRFEHLKSILSLTNFEQAHWSSVWPIQNKYIYIYIYLCIYIYMYIYLCIHKFFPYINQRLSMACFFQVPKPSLAVKTPSATPWLPLITSWLVAEIPKVGLMVLQSMPCFIGRKKAECVNLTFKESTEFLIAAHI